MTIVEYIDIHAAIDLLRRAAIIDTAEWCRLSQMADDAYMAED